MKGVNELFLNEETVKEALQEYFDKRTNYEGQFTVTLIEQVSNNEFFRVVTSTKDNND